MEAQPQKPGFVLVRFYENVKPFEETRDGLTISGYEYDEYHLELADTGDLQGDILNLFEYYFEVAKQQEEEVQEAAFSAEEVEETIAYVRGLRRGLRDE